MGSARRKSHRVPVAIFMFLAVMGATFLVLPLAGLAARAPWGRLSELLSRAETVDALLISLAVSAIALLLAALFGIPLAWCLARMEFPGRKILRAVVLLPMVLPPVVAGVGLLTALGRRGLLGGVLRFASIEIPFTTAAAVLAAAYVGAPFLIVAAEAAFRSSDRRSEEAAATLGAGRARTFLHVVIPSVRTPLIAGAALCWARALGEFGATIVFAGNLQGTTQTTPLLVFQDLQRGDLGAAVLMSLILFVISLALLLALRRFLWRERDLAD